VTTALRRAALALALAVSLPVHAHEGAAARLDRLDAALHLNPDDADARLRRADERRRAGDLAGARADLELLGTGAVDRDSLAVAWAQVELDGGRAEAALERLADVSGGASVHDLRADALDALGQGACRERLAALTASPTPDRAAAAFDACPAPSPDLARALGHAEEHLGFVGHVRRLRIQATADPVHALSLSDELVVRLPSPDALLLRASLQPTNAAREADLAAAVDLARARLTRRATPLRRLALARALISAGQPTAGRRELAVVLAEAPDLDAARALAAQLPEDP